MQHYILVVQAQDTGRPSLSSTVTVYFNVMDLNDNAPVFDPMSYSDEVFENITVGSRVLQVQATDQDSGERGSKGGFFAAGTDTVNSPLMNVIMFLIQYSLLALIPPSLTPSSLRQA